MKVNEIDIKDINIIYEVCNHLSYKYNITGIEREDLKQELVLRGLYVFTNYWDENRKKFKNPIHRESNIRIFMKNNLSRYTKNIKDRINAEKRRGDLTSIPFTESMSRYYEEDSIDIDSDIFSEEEIIVMQEIVEKKLPRLNQIPVKSIVERGISADRQRIIVKDLRNNEALYEKIR